MAELGVDLGRAAGQPLVAILVDDQQQEENHKQAHTDADVVDRGLGALIPVQEWIDPGDNKRTKKNPSQLCVFVFNWSYHNNQTTKQPNKKKPPPA